MEAPKKKKKDGKKTLKRGEKKDEHVEEFDDDDDCNYMFVVNRWFAKNEDDGQIVRELVPTDATGTRLRADSLAGIVYTMKGISVAISDCHCNSRKFHQEFSAKRQKSPGSL